MVDDFSDGNFSGANAPLLMYICVSSLDFPFRVFGFCCGFCVLTLRLSAATVFTLTLSLARPSCAPWSV